MFKFNPTIKEYLENNPDTTIIDLAWSIVWRVYIGTLIVAFILGVLSEIF